MGWRKKFDMHTHHSRCGHAIGTIEEYILSAIDAKLDVIGISDHMPHVYSEVDQPYPEIAMAKSDLPLYVDEVLGLKEKYAHTIDVLLGIEADYFIQHSQAYRKALQQFPFDYIIGSVHYVDGDSIFNENRWGHLSDKEQIKLKNKYYKMIQQGAKSGMYQIMGHLDAMKANYPAFSEIETTELDNTLKIIGEKGIPIEVNTSGKTKKVGGWYPANDILEKALFYDVDVTFGSDAHTPNRVGEDFALVEEKLRDIGYNAWCYVKQQKKVYVPLI